MKISLKVAVAGVIALAGANAMASTPAQIQTAASNGTLVTLYVSGATATDGALENLFKIDDAAFRVCLPNTMDVYYFKSTSGSASQRALTCTAGFSATGVTSGTTTLALLKESAGGSANGIINPATNAPLQFIDIVNGASNFATVCATVSSTSATLPNSTGSFNMRDCGFVSGTASSVTRTNFIPQAGISDVDPNTFVGLGGVTSAHNAALTRKRTSVAVTFNPIVSVPMFTALQRAYGYIGDNATEDTTLLANVPSLPSATLRAIFNGNSILNASEINVNGVKLDTKLNGLADQSGDIYLCRRGDTSGTMTSFKLHFLGQGCNKNVASNITFITPDTSSCVGSGCVWNSTQFGSDFVFAGAGSGDVRSCMDYQTSQGRLAVGIASTESKPNATNRFRYIKVDGAEPTLKAVMEGRYSFFTENTFNDKFPGTSATGSQSLWDKLFNSIGNAVALSEVNRPWRNSLAIGGADNAVNDTGILDTASSSNATAIGNLFLDGAISATEVRATPVNSQTRQTLTGGANNCNLPYQAYP